MFKSKIETELDREIESVLAKLAKTDKTTDDYNTLVERLSKLHRLKTEQDKNGPKFRPSTDTVLIVSANIFCVLWLARYERENPPPSKSALGFVPKLR
jgi:hypothetical protein